jgi:hypothetical protein
MEVTGLLSRLFKQCMVLILPLLFPLYGFGKLFSLLTGGCQAQEGTDNSSVLLSTSTDVSPRDFSLLTFLSTACSIRDSSAVEKWAKMGCLEARNQPCFLTHGPCIPLIIVVGVGWLERFRSLMSLRLSYLAGLPVL